MSRSLSRVPRAALLLALLAVAALPATAPAKGKATSPCVTKGKAKAHAKGKSKAKRCTLRQAPQTRVSVDLLEGSHATVDIPAVPLPGGYVLPGVPATRDVPVSGRLTGSTPAYLLGKDNTIKLDTAAIGLAPVDLLLDGACAGASVLRLNPASNVILDDATPAAAKIFADGRVQASLTVVLGLAFDSRTGTTCDSPLTSMGNATTKLPLTVTGKIQRPTGLAALALDGPPTAISVAVCLTPGPAGSPCLTPPVAYPVTIAVHVVAKVGFLG